MNRFFWRRVTTLTLTVSFLLMVYSGIMLFLTPQGRIANWANWSLGGLTKEQYSAVHINFMVLFLTTAALHIYFNWKVLIAFLKNRARRFVLLNREFVIALVLCLVVLTGTLAQWPPFRNLMALNESIKDSWAKSYGEPPYGHAELSSLQLLSQRLGLDPGQARQRLEASGFRVADLQQTLAELAAINGVSPQDLYEKLLPDSGAADPVVQLSDDPGKIPSLGRKTLAELAERGLFRLPDALRLLQARGVTATADTPLKELAGQLGMSPRDLLEFLRQKEESGGR
ncbi:MAG: DUF4405 domain-containing protein [Acidobacteria bacterium]|nr:DUF4405 domain-containing protein [Acidobacteriota bacterium]